MGVAIYCGTSRGLTGGFFFPWNMTIMSEHLLSRAGRDNASVEHGSLVIQLLSGNAFLGVTGFLCVAGLGSSL